MAMAFEQIRARTKSVEEVAAFTFRLTGGNAKPEIVAESFRRGAVQMREIAAKAAAAKSGKYRGLTQTQALELAAEQAARSVSVPAALRALIANAH